MKGIKKYFKVYWNKSARKTKTAAKFRALKIKF